MNKIWNLVAALLALVVGAMILGGCRGEKEVDLSFETIERSDSAGTGEYYEEEDPQLVVVTKTEEVDDRLGNTVSFDAQTQLESLDYDLWFAIAVFQGWRPHIPTPQSGVKIPRISREENTITVYAQFYEPVQGYEMHPEVNSPYHLVKIQKGENMRGEFGFVLNVDGKELVRKTHFIP